MPTTPPTALLDLIENCLVGLLEKNPLATSSEAFVRENVELEVVQLAQQQRYGLRIGINYHGDKVQHIQLDVNGVIKGWNHGGNCLSSGNNAKMRLGGHTIFDRNPGEQVMSDAKFFGGGIPAGQFVRCEFKVRGWLGKTRNLDGSQMLKDFDLLARDKADLLVICLSEVAYRKWRGEGPPSQVARRTGIQYMRPIFQQIADYDPTTLRLDGAVALAVPTWNGMAWVPGAFQTWQVRRRKVVALANSSMPGAEHYIVMCWRDN